MKYRAVVTGEFLRRPNRFIAKVAVDGKEETVHVKNTGRCKELLVPGATVYLEKSDNPLRKTRYDLIAVRKIRENGEPLLINMDSQVPNDVAEEWISQSGYFGTDVKIRREVFYGESRFDFYLESGERKIFMEVKGCTLERDGVCLFPDAPTERGVKHIKELMACMADGYEAYLLFVVQMKGMKFIAPNYKMHRAFGETLHEAAEKGVRVISVECDILPDEIRASGFLPVKIREI